MLKRISLTLMLFSCVVSAHAQQVNPGLLKQHWSAYWIQVPGAPARDYGVYLFRKTFELPAKRDKLVVHVSGDNRYMLMVNGQTVSMGPARNDLYHWNFETVNIAPYLQPGKNTIAALVWNEGDYRPEGQISNRTGFLLQPDDQADIAFATNTTWKCMQDSAYRPITGIGYSAYYVAGPGELVDMHKQPAGWMSSAFDDSAWPNAATVGWRTATPKGTVDIGDWMLVPSTLPQMELTPQRFATVRQSEGILLPNSFPAVQTALTIPAQSQVSFLLDQSFLTNAYPRLSFSKGNNATISLTYAEALFEEKPDAPGKTFRKGNRNEVEGKIMAGRRDSIISNGQDNQQFSTLNWRTFRYVQVRITTDAEPLILDDISSVFTGYPFTFNAALHTKDAMLNRILETGWRTARLCAVETYMDCPYYEQLQYIGDGRIQAMVSLYNSGDDRLVRNAISQMDNSRMAEGITLSRHPSYSPQQIPTFSLWYIGMVYDYWMYRGDSAFVAGKMQGIRDVLWFFSKYQQKDGTLRGVPYWMFTDWVENRPGWNGGTAPYGKNGSSAVLDLQLLWALQLAARLEMQFGAQANAAAYTSQAKQLQATIKKQYWHATRQLFADTGDKDLFSQHANALAILTNTITGADATALAKKMLSDASLAPASIYFKYYLHLACVKAGLGNDYLKWLDIWRENISMGMTTWAEISEISQARSDCHAWGSSPNIELFRIVLGIDSDAPGFAKVKIEPHLGDITAISGSIPHPSGKITAGYALENGKWMIDISLPAKITGRLLWKGKQYALKPGSNHLDL